MLYSLLLAGGKSSRMGKDKSTLVYEGQTLLERSLDLLNQLGADHVLISGDIQGHDSIPDLLPDCGPFGGLHAAIHFIDKKSGMDGSLLLLIPVDMPMLDEQSLITLIESTGDAGSCFYQGEVFPCVFRLTSQLKNHLDSLFSKSTELGGDRSMKALLRAFTPKVLKSTALSRNVFFNLNSQQDWERFKKIDM